MDDENGENYISGKLLVSAAEGYSFKNLHKNFQIKLLPNLKLSADLLNEQTKIMLQFAETRIHHFDDYFSQELENLQNKNIFQKSLIEIIENNTSNMAKKRK
jgi:hypothetical protein